MSERSGSTSPRRSPSPPLSPPPPPPPPPPPGSKNKRPRTGSETEEGDSDSSRRRRQKKQKKQHKEKHEKPSHHAHPVAGTSTSISLSAQDLDAVSIRVAELLQKSLGLQTAAPNLAQNPSVSELRGSAATKTGARDVTPPSKGFCNPEDGVTLHAPSVSGFTDGQKSRVSEDFGADEEDSRLNEGKFKKVLDLLQEVLGPRLPVRNVKSAGLVSMSDRSDCLSQHVDPKCFPHSQLVSSAFQHIMQAITGEDSPDMSDPTRLPHKLDTTPMMSNSQSRRNPLKIPGYADRFYGLSTDSFTILPPEVDRSLRAHVFGEKENKKWKSEKYLSATDMAKVERSLRRCMAINSSVDVLLDAIQTITDSAGLSENENLKELFSAMSRSVAHLAAHAAQGVSAAMMFRRNAFLKSAGSKIPSTIHDWLLCQPMIAKDDQTTSLFGNIAGKVREFKQQEDKAAANVSLSKMRPPATSGNKRSSAQENKTIPVYRPSSAGNRSSGNKYGGRPRGSFSGRHASNRGRR